MSIELLKELEDLKQIQKDLSPQLKQQINAKIKQSIRNAFNDFERFFKEKGFEIQTRELNITASYGSLIADLKHNDLSIQYFGTYLHFDLYLQLLHKTQHVILLNPKDHHPGISVSFANGDQSDEIKQIQKEIERTKIAIEKDKNRIETLPNDAWAFFLKEESATNRPSMQEFDSFYDLLGTLVK